MYEMTELIKITPRERVVLQELLTCDTNRDLADALCISIHTVRSHVSSLLEKFQVNSRHRLIHLAYCWGFIRIDGTVIDG